MTLYTQKIEDIDPKLKDVSPEERAQYIQNYHHRSEGKSAAFKEWVDKLNSNEKRPRGKFFKNYKRKILVLDEAWKFAATLPVRDDGKWLRIPNHTTAGEPITDFQTEPQS